MHGLFIYAFENLKEPLLPARRLWKNSLAGGEVSVNPSEYSHAFEVFSKFACRSIGDYHDHYLTTDVLFLASVFDAFRSVCYETYGVDCAHNYTASILSSDLFLKVCRADLRKLDERNHLDLEQNISGGMSSVYATKFLEGKQSLLSRLP